MLKYKQTVSLAYLNLFLRPLITQFLSLGLGKGCDKGQKYFLAWVNKFQVFLFIYFCCHESF